MNQSGTLFSAIWQKNSLFLKNDGIADRIPGYYLSIMKNKTKQKATNSKTAKGYKHEKPR
jgi:hypothetical protein